MRPFVARASPRACLLGARASRPACPFVVRASRLLLRAWAIQARPPFLRHRRPTHACISFPGPAPPLRPDNRRTAERSNDAFFPGSASFSKSSARFSKRSAPFLKTSARFSKSNARFSKGHASFSRECTAFPFRNADSSKASSSFSKSNDAPPNRPGMRVPRQDSRQKTGAPFSPHVSFCLLPSSLCLHCFRGMGGCGFPVTAVGWGESTHPPVLRPCVSAATAQRRRGQRVGKCTGSTLAAPLSFRTLLD